MTTPKPPSPEDREAAQTLRRQINDLPDYYEYGGDGGQYHALSPGGVMLIEETLAARAEQARQQERERCAKLACVGCRNGEPTRKVTFVKLPYPNCIVVHYDAARPEEKMYRRECRAVECGILEGR